MSSTRPCASRTTPPAENSRSTRAWSGTPPIIPVRASVIPCRRTRVMDRVDLLGHFHPGFTPRREQARLLASLADAIGESLHHPAAPQVLVVEEPHGLEVQLVNVFTVAFPPAESAAWFGGPLPRLDDAEDYRNLLGDHLERMEGQLESLDRALEGLRPAFVSPEHFLSMPPS